MIKKMKLKICKPLFFSILLMSIYLPKSVLAVANTPTAPTVTWEDQGINSGDTQKITLYGVLPVGADRLFYKLSANNTYYYYGPTTELSHQFNNINDEQTVDACLRAYDSLDNYSSYSPTTAKVIGDRTSPAVPAIPTAPIIQWIDNGLNSADDQRVDITKPSHPSGVDKWRVSYSSGVGTSITTWMDVYSTTIIAQGDIHDSQLVVYRIQWRAHDASGNWADSVESPQVSVDIGDRTAPGTNGNVQISWQDQGINSGDTQMVTMSIGGITDDTYEFIYKLSANATTYSFGPNLLTVHQYDSVNDSQTVSGYLYAYDASGNSSISTGTITIGDRTPPSVPAAPWVVWEDQGPNSAYTQKVVVSGTLPSGANRFYYKLLADNSTYYYGLTTAPSHKFENLYDGQEVYGCLKAYDVSGNFSDYGLLASTAIAIRTTPSAPSNPGMPVVLWNDQGANSGDTQRITILKPEHPYGVIQWRVSYSSGTGTDTIGWIPVSTTTYLDFNIHDNQAVCYKVQWKAYDEYGNWALSYESSEGSVYIENRTPPAIAGAPLITWNDQGPNTGDSQKATLSGSYPEGASSFLYKLIANNATYYYGPAATPFHQFENIKDEQIVDGFLMAYDAQGNYSICGPSSSAVIGDRTPPEPPGAPAGPLAIWVDHGINSMDTQEVSVVRSTNPAGIDWWCVSSSYGIGTDTSCWISISTNTYLDSGVSDEQTVRYKIRWRNYDDNGNWANGPESPYAEVISGDRTPPPDPIAPSVNWDAQGANSGDSQKVTLSGNLPLGANKLYYKIIANNTTYFYGPVTELSHQFININDNQQVCGYIMAYDSENNFSQYSLSTTEIIGNRTPPSIPDVPDIEWNDQGVNSENSQKVTLSGSLPPGANRLYYRLTADNTGYYYGPISTLTHDFNNIEDEQIVHGWTRAYDIDNNYSDYGSTAVITIGDRTPPSIPVLPDIPLGEWSDKGINSGDNQAVILTKPAYPAEVSQWQVSYSSGYGTNISGWVSVSVSTFQDAGVYDQQEVYYRIKWKAIDASGNWADSPESSQVSIAIGDRTALSKPASPSVIPGNRFVQLQWQAAAEPDVSTYIIYKDTGTGYNLLTSLSEPATNYIDSGLINHNTYYYIMMSKDISNNESPYSAEVKCIPYDNIQPSAVTDLTAYPGSIIEGEIKLIWTAPGDEGTIGTATGYILRMSQLEISAENWSSADNIGNIPAPSLSATKEQLTLTGLIPGTVYYYALMVYDEQENISEISNSPGACALDLIPEPPQNPAIIRGKVEAMVSWPANNEKDINHYNIYRSLKGYAGDYTLMFSTGSTTYLDSDLLQGNTYSYKITAVDNTHNESAYSVTVSTYIILIVPEHPAEFKGTGASPTAIKWSWKDNSNNEYGFRVLNSTGGIVVSLERNGTYWMENNLFSNTSYFRYVQAFNPLAISASGTDEIYTLAVVPSGLTSLVQTASTINLSWADNNADGFAIERALDVSGSQGPWSVIIEWTAKLSSECYSDTGREPDTYYWYRIGAYNGDALLSSYSSSIYIKTKDIAAPSGITNLKASPGFNEGEVNLSWTAPGDNGMEGNISGGIHEVKWSTVILDGWGSDNIISWQIISEAPGYGQSRTITGLSNGTTYYFWIKTADEVPLWSIISGTATAYAKNDIVPPAVAAISAGSISHDYIQIKWIASGDNSNSGQADFYDLRYSTLGPINSLYEFMEAVPVTGLPAPKMAGGPESFIVGNLERCTTYYFSLRIADEVPLWSGLSNSLKVVTLFIDIIAPNEPMGVRGEWINGGKNFNLSWSQVILDENNLPCNDLKGYNIYQASKLNGNYVLRDYISKEEPLSWTEPADISGVVFYYAVRAVDTTGNESSRSLVTDSSIYENVMVFSEDRRAVLTIPKQVRGVLLNSDNEYNDDIRLNIQKIDSDLSNKVVCAYIIRAYKAKTGEEVKNLSFSRSKTEFMLSYEGTAGYSANKTAGGISATTGSELGVFWYDGANYINLGGYIDESNQAISLKTEHIGSYRVQRVLRAAELRITAIWPRKTFTPNGDGINDTFNIQFENPWESNIHGYVYDLNGTLVTEFMRDGDKLYWDGRDDNSATVKSGVYIYQLRGENKTITGTVIVAR